MRAFCIMAVLVVAGPVTAQKVYEKHANAAAVGGSLKRSVVRSDAARRYLDMPLRAHYQPGPAALRLPPARFRTSPTPSQEDAPQMVPPGGLLYFASYRQRDNPAPTRNPHLVGALFTVYWSDVEPRAGVFDWSTLDRRIALWTAAGKKVAVRLMWSSSGTWPEPAAKHPTPQFVLDAGAVIVRAEKSNTEVPLVWDPVYRRYAVRFLREAARKFDGDPNVLFIDVTPGDQSVSLSSHQRSGARIQGTLPPHAGQRWAVLFTFVVAGDGETRGRRRAGRLPPDAAAGDAERGEPGRPRAIPGHRSPRRRARLLRGPERIERAQLRHGQPAPTRLSRLGRADASLL